MVVTVVVAKPGTVDATCRVAFGWYPVPSNVTPVLAKSDAGSCVGEVSRLVTTSGPITSTVNGGAAPQPVLVALNTYAPAFAGDCDRSKNSVLLTAG